jgi:hypothetical protein
VWIPVDTSLCISPPSHLYWEVNACFILLHHDYYFHILLSIFKNIKKKKATKENERKQQKKKKNPTRQKHPRSKKKPQKKPNIFEPEEWKHYPKYRSNFTTPLHGVIALLTPSAIQVSLIHHPSNEDDIIIYI